MVDKLQRVAIYLRVSTEDQHTENQLLQLRQFCESWEGHELVAESGSHNTVKKYLKRLEAEVLPSPRVGDRY